MKCEKMPRDSQIKIFRILFVSSISLTLIWLLVTLAVSSKSRPVKISLWQGNEGHKEVVVSDTRNRKHLKSILRCKDSDLKMEILFRGDHWILQNMITGLRSRKMGCAEAITFATVADYSYLMHLETLVERWMGPISLALFAPGDDFHATMNAIQYARLCLPISKLVRDYVTFHIYFPSGHLPVDGIPRTPLEALKWPANCSEPYAPYENVRRRDLYWHWLQLGLPINLGRNVARRSINTHYALVADIELYPSKDFIPQFLEMISRNTSLVMSKNRHVFAVPAFDLDHHAMVPDTKEDLMTMYNMGMAMEMHHRSCSYCQLIPEEQKWLERDSMAERMEVVSVVKRYTSIPFWEPFFVSDPRVPDYDERLLWQWKYDKRMHNYAMCLLGYEYYILHPAFLTHSPGPTPFDVENTRMFTADEEIVEMVPEYAVVYGINERCEV